MDPTPAPIPRRLVFRALADALGGQARHLEGMSPGRSRARRATAGGAAKSGRAMRAARLAAQASEFSRWVGDPARYQGAGIDAAIVGYLIALAYGHAEAMVELRAELADLGRPGVLDGVAIDDLITIMERL